MATTTARTKKRKPEAQAQDHPLLDMSDQDVKRLIKKAKQRGYVT